jgi:hypothetical protein
MENKISLKEWYKIVIIITIVLFLTTLPYLYGWFITPTNKVFTGLHGINSGDTYSYIAWLQQAKEGHVFFKDLYTSESQRLALFHPLFLFMGLVARLTQLPSIFIFHFFRLVLGFCFLLVCYKFISHFFDKAKERFVAFLLLITSAGFGWATSLYSTDTWMSESITFLSLYESVLNIAGLLIVVFIFIKVIDGSVVRNKHVFFLVAALLNVLILVHPYDFVTIAVVVGIYYLYQAYATSSYSLVYKYIWLIVLSAPAALLQLYALHKNPILAVWANYQTSVPSPHPILYILGYGFLSLFALVGSIVIWHRKSVHRIFLTVWLVSTIVLLYFPLFYRFQRKFAEGLHIPLVICAATGLIWLIEYRFSRERVVKTCAYGAVILYCSFTNITVVWRDIKLFQKEQRPFYITKQEKDAIDWLGNHSNSTDIILSGYGLGNLIPGMTGKIVYLGHGDQTVNFRSKYKIASQAFSTPIKYNEPFKFFVRENDISYVVVDDEVRSWGAVDLSQRPYLTLAYKNSDVEIYKVQ